MAKKLPRPENYVIIPGDRSGLSSWSPVEGAAGYIIDYYRTDAPEDRVARYYTQATRKNVLGLINGVEYFSNICAFTYEKGQEVLGLKSRNFYFVPISNSLTAQKNIALDVGDSAMINWSYMNEEHDIEFHTGDSSKLAVLPDGEITAYNEGVTNVSLTLDTGDTANVNVIIGRNNNRYHVKKTTILFTGDILPGFRSQRALSGYGYDYSQIISEGVKDIFNDVDYVAGVLNTCCDDHSVYTSEELCLDNGSLNYNCPSTLIDALQDAGMKGIFTATRHNADCGLSGLKNTSARITEAGMTPIGTLSHNPVIRKINGTRIAFINLSQVSNGMDDCSKVKEDDLGRYSDDYAELLINEAKAKKVDFIIVVMNWGVANSSVVTAKQRISALHIAECGADVIIGSGSFTPQAYEELHTSNGRVVPCIYSLGCFYSELWDLKTNSYGNMAKVTICEDSRSYSCRLTLVPTVCLNNHGLTTITPVEPVFTKAQEDVSKAIHSFYPDILFDSLPHTSLLIQGSLIIEPLTKKLPYLFEYMSIEPGRLAGPYEYLILDLTPFTVVESPMEALKNYLQKVHDIYPSEKVILIRIDLPDIGVRGKNIEEVDDDEYSEVNHLLYDLEEEAIELIHPIIIDLSEYYFLNLEAPEDHKEFEDYFYINCAKIIISIVENNPAKFYYNDPDSDIWIDRIEKYHQSLLDSPVRNQMIGDCEAADIIIANSSYNLVSQFKDELLLLKELHAELPYAKKVISDSYSNIALIRKIDELLAEMEEE